MMATTEPDLDHITVVIVHRCECGCGSYDCSGDSDGQEGESPDGVCSGVTMH